MYVDGRMHNDKRKKNNEETSEVVPLKGPPQNEIKEC